MMSLVIHARPIELPRGWSASGVPGGGASSAGAQWRPFIGRISAAGSRFDKVLAVLREKLAQFREGGVPDLGRRIVAFQLRLTRSKVPDRRGPRPYIVHSGGPEHQICFQFLGD